MHQTGFEVAAFDNPFHRATVVREFPEGLSVDQIIKEAEIDTRMYLHLQVTITLGSRSSVVPMSAWSKVRPKRGCHVQIAPVLHGAVLAPLLTTIITAAAPTIAGALFPALAAGSLGLALATAAVSVVGTLLVRAIIPPPQQNRAGSATQDDPVFTLTGASNDAKAYEVYPTVLGRHIMFPVKTAAGYTETVGDSIYLRERMTFGYGPVSLSDMKIGTTAITDFEDVEIEFLNVDEARTLAAMPELAGDNITVVGWRQGSEAMTLYPDDIAEDNYSVLLEADQSVVRQTRALTRSAHVDISFQGLVRFNDKGGKDNRTVQARIEYRAVGDSDWTVYETKSCVENTTAYVRFTSVIDFPTEGTYDIRVTRLTANTDDGKIRDKANLTAIRSIQSGQLPSHPEIAEIAVRLKASNELNGQIQNLNAVVQQLAPVWDGTSWSQPQPVRHPAWIYARALMGAQLRDAVADTRLDLPALKAWADEEPHWTCDLIIDQATRLAEVLDLICATGRAKRGLSDLKYSVIRDGGAGGIVQHFTPRTSWGFTGRKFLDREIHAFRVRVVSERKDWAIDEVLVYADGYDASNATEIETLSLPGIVLDADGDDQGNAYRLARYHLAVAKLRPEEFYFYSDLDHIPCQMGDKVRIVHDVPLFGVGSGRVKSASETQIIIDEWHHVAESDGPYRLRVRKSDGDEIVVNADHVSEGVWDLAATITDIPEPDDLVMVEEIAAQPVDILITGIQHLDELKARITAVPAAPDVLTADTGTIPDYDPQITRNSVTKLDDPTMVRVFSGAAAADGSRVRIGVEVANPSYRNILANYHQIRYRLSGLQNWTQPAENRSGTIFFTDELVEGGEYEIEVRAVTNNGQFSNWTAVTGTTYATLTYDVPFDVEDFEVAVLNGYATFTWRSVDPNPYRFHIKFSENETRWENAVDVNNSIDGRSFSVPAVNGNYLIKAVSQTGQRSINPKMVTVTSANIQSYDVVLPVNIDAPFNGQASGSVAIIGDELVFSNGGDLHTAADWFEIDDIFTEGNSTTTGYYTLEDDFDLGEVATVRLSSRVNIAAKGVSPMIHNITDFFDISNIFGDIPDDWIVRIEEQHTSDNPDDAGATWTNWGPITFGNYTTRAFRFRLFFQSGEDALSIFVTSASVSIDVPERFEFGRDVDCPTGGVTVNFGDEFYSVPSLVIDGQDLPSGAVLVRTVTTSGFTISYVDAVGTPISASFDWHAVGFGRRGAG